MKNQILNNWQKVKIQDICNVVTGGTPRTDKPEYWGGDINWMSSGEVNKHRVVSVEKRITKNGLNNSNARLLPVGTIMIALAGQGKTRGKAAILDIETTCNQSLAGLIVKDRNVVDPEYLFQNLDSLYEDLRSLSGGAGRSGLNLNLIRNFQITIPPIILQKKYSQVLLAVDESIQKTDQIIKTTEKLKEGLMQNLFANKNWSTAKFESIFRIPLKNGLNRPTSMRGSGIKMVNMGELFKYPRIYDQKMELVPFSESESDFYLKEGDLLFARQSLVREGAGKCSIYLGKDNLITYEGHIIRVRLDKNKVNSLFYFYLFQSSTGRSKIEQLITQTAAAGIRGSDLARIQIPVPTKPIQNEVVSTLLESDTKLEHQYRVKLKLALLKHGLMNDIFSRNIEIKI